MEFSRSGGEVKGVIFILSKGCCGRPGSGLIDLEAMMYRQATEITGGI